jgi:hypothetical protein
MERIIKVDGTTEKIILLENDIRTIRVLNKTATTFEYWNYCRFSNRYGRCGRCYRVLGG